MPMATDIMSQNFCQSRVLGPQHVTALQEKRSWYISDYSYHHHHHHYYEISSAHITVRHRCVAMPLWAQHIEVMPVG